MLSIAASQTHFLFNDEVCDQIDRFFFTSNMYGCINVYNATRLPYLIAHGVRKILKEMCTQNFKGKFIWRTQISKYLNYG